MSARPASTLAVAVVLVAFAIVAFGARLAYLEHRRIIMLI
jgi:hypothetical protein